MRLNLGCGRLLFPATWGDARLDHLKDWLPDSVYHMPDWVNVDRLAVEGVDQQVDVMIYPWPWADNSVKEIWASHLIEHIPHQAALTPEASSSPALLRMGKLDGWYAWFYEAWRVLEPDGVLHVVCPYAFSTAGMSDPTHHRYITPASFSYLAGDKNGSAPFDYQLEMQFEAEGDAMVSMRGDEITTKLHHDHRDLYDLMMFFGKDILDGMYVALRANKNAD